MVAYLLILVAFVLLVVDWAQTLTIAREPERFYEAWNLVLPEHPSVPQVHTWFFGVAVLSAIALWLLPELRTWIAGCIALLEAMCVVNNIRKGIKP